MKKTVFIFLSVFIVSFGSQQFLLPRVESADKKLWAEQTKYFFHQTPQAENIYLAYGYPGTTLFGAGIFFHQVFQTSWYNALILGTSLLIAFACAGIVAVAYRLRPHSYWWLLAALVVLVNRMYYSTPPTAVAMPFVTLVILYSWLVYERRPRHYWWAIVWGLIVGLAAATRIDAAALPALIFLAILWHRLGWRQGLVLTVAGAGGFFIADPYLWSMPMEHIQDLLNKFSMFHQLTVDGEMVSGKVLYAPNTQRLPITAGTLDFFFWPLISLLISLFIMLRRPRGIVIPNAILLALYLITILTVVIVMTAKFQVNRYFFPLFLTWDVLLPLVIITARNNPPSKKPPTNISGHRLLFLQNSLAWIMLIGWMLLNTFLLDFPVIRHY